MKTEFMTRNRINFLRRNVAGLKGAVALAFVLAVSTPVHLARHLLAGRNEHVRSLIKGLLWHARPRCVLKNERLASSSTYPKAISDLNTGANPGGPEYPESISDLNTGANPSRRAA